MDFNGLKNHCTINGESAITYMYVLQQESYCHC